MIEIAVFPKAPGPEIHRADLNYAVMRDGKIRAAFWTELMARDYVDWILGNGYTGAWEVREIAAMSAGARSFCREDAVKGRGK